MKEHLGPNLFFLVVLFQAIRAWFAMESFRAVLKPEQEEIRWGTETVSPFGRSTTRGLRRFSHWDPGWEERQDRKSFKTSSFWRVYGLAAQLDKIACLVSSFGDYLSCLRRAWSSIARSGGDESSRSFD